MLKLKYHPHLVECGTDEAGRGCLAGPVTAAAVLLPDYFQNELLTDSKLLSEKNRKLLQPLIEKEALAFGVTHIMMEEIDQINILNASIKAMQDSVSQIQTHLSKKSALSASKHDKLKLEHILVDGNRFKPLPDLTHTCIVKGDSKYLAIAAASILAKTARDAYMEAIHKEFPMYNWKRNKGYPTKEHREAIKRYGITKYHRKSFRLLPEQYQLDFNTSKG
ncbi:MAG: ribonuclease HII [Cytophagaceae bacterium]|nr:ribonuclease HII [Cytophagaceae bacterium]